MHKSSLKIMEKMRDKYLSFGRVLDIGSKDHNGTYKPLFEGYDYYGVDREEGKNVDIVMESEYDIPVLNESIDIVITGQCIEHVRNPFRLMADAVRCLKPGGYLICIAPHKDGIHRYPIDTFRYNPDGMIAIFEEAGLHTLECDLGEKGSNIIDCYYVGQKPVQLGGAHD